MAALIGTVSKVVGLVFAETAGGQRRPLVEGDRLYAGEHLVTGAEGAVAVQLQNGHELTLGRGSDLTLTPQLLANQTPHVDTPEAATPSDAQLTDVQELQQAIAAGADPTQAGEATAAGPGAGNAAGGLGGGHSFVLLEEVGGRVEPQIGFPTAGFNGIPEFPQLRLAAEPDNDGNNDGTVPPVTPPDNPVTLDGVDTQGGELTTNEANLADGTAANPGALVQSGTFTVSAPDGLSSLSIGGISVIANGVPAGFPQTITSPLGNTLTITGYDPATGVVGYTYTLTDNETHPAGGGANSITEQFAVVAVDTDGDTATGTLDVNITDDVPQAIDDSNANTASETLVTLTGNVLPNDHQGADRIPTGPDSGPIIGGTFTGTYGTLVLNPNGTYTYTLNTNDPQFVALQGGGSGTETFAYTLTDSDGDTSTANLVLQIHNNDDPVVLVGLDAAGGELSLQEKNLSDGSS
ncbi:retention module-containing protein, partial [Pseudomonas sp. SMV71]|uniref:retention module-containing protein n=1 Tax=Pseudomonas sp. SMV71 TaxID=3390195 RepID=UPI003F851448